MLKFLKVLPVVLATTLMSVPAQADSSLYIVWRNARKDPNIGNRLWTSVYWRVGEQRLQAVEEDGKIVLKPASETHRQDVWVECDGKPWHVWHEGTRYNFIGTQENACNRVFGREIVPDATNRFYHNNVLAICMDKAKSATTREGLFSIVNPCLLYHGLNSVPVDMGLAPALM